ncbi:MAG TPA: hypothetical protein PK683_08970 [Leptospiraceae bacterium]|nr:hypothetical protein [Leptospiraceae bacterium]
MNKFTRLVPFISLYLLSCLSMNAEDKTPPKIDVSSGTVIWYDGADKKTSYIMKDYVAEFEGSSGSKIKAVDKNASTLKQSVGKLKIHKVTDESIKNSLSRAEVPKSLKDAGDFVPVFSDSNSEHGIGVPHNVIVGFESSVTESDAEKFAKEYKTRIKQKLGFGNLYVLESDPGLAAIELANYLRTQKSVVTASPDWYRQAVRR